MKDRISFVQLEANAFLSDVDFQTMTAQQRGVYCTIIFYLYANGGKFPFDPEGLKMICNCAEFEKVWEKIAHKFSKGKKFLRHKRVTKELRKAAGLPDR